MKKKLLFVLLIFVLTFASGCETKEVQAVEPSLEVSKGADELSSSRIIADRFVESLSSKDYSTVYSLLGPDIKKMVGSTLGVRLLWGQLTAIAGEYISYDEPELILSAEGTDTYQYPAEFKNGKYIVEITVKDDLISGLDMSEAKPAEEVSLGVRYFDAVINNNYDDVYEMSDATLKGVFDSSGGFGNLWNQITSQVGQYVSSEDPYITEMGSMKTYVFISTFELSQCVVQISEIDGKIAGFLIQPIATDTVNINELAKEEGPKASGDLPEGILEKDIIINKGQEHELYGKLTYPANATGPIPAVILVQGSGSSDMNEAINEHNAPFKDLAYGLSQNGVAILRYNKVTYAYPQDFDNATITIDEETVNDAVAAKTALLEQSDMEFSHIYVAGHSLGGMMAPKIASLGDYDGMIILAGTTRSLVDVVYDQYMYALTSTYPDANERAPYAETYENIYEEAKKVMSLPPDELAGKYAMGLSAKYVYTMENPSPVEYIKELDIPMLILQGSKDFQVLADKDFVLYEEVTKGLSDVTMIEYEGLNHMFMESFMERPDGTEYSVPSKVDDKVIKDISDWILAR